MAKNPERYSILIALILATLLTSCQDCAPIYSYEEPDQRKDELATGALGQVGIDSIIISRAIDCIDAGKYDQVHSILIYKDSLLVLEEYFEGNKYKWDAKNYHGERIQWDIDSLHVIMSCTKSIVSACVGIAINKGYIKDVNESIFNYLPEHQQFNKEGKSEITIEHLLTMTSGLEWNEWGAHDPSSNDIDRIYSYCQSDPISCVLAKPLKYAPGEKFTYNGGGFIILGEILKNATSRDIEEFSKTYLFAPLSIESFRWYQFQNGTYACDGSLVMKPRDMLKIGITYLNKGQWGDTRVLSEAWVNLSQREFNNNRGINIPIDDSGRNGYAYSWWTNEISVSRTKVKLFQAGGWGGQEVIVFPDLNMVVVFTGGNYTNKKHIYEILKKYILAAVE
jgi:CubicO group peptidase (beta-lactamase class C family)